MPIEYPSVVVLADPPCGKGNLYAGTFPNLGILYLAAALRRKVSGIAIYYLDANFSPEEHLVRVISLRPSVYGISFSSQYSGSSYEIINSVRTHLPNTLIVCGGAHPTSSPQEVLEKSVADVCCLGEGEITFSQLVDAYIHGEPFHDIDGLAYRNKDGGIRINPLRPLVKNLDDLDFPAWDLVDFARYTGCRRSKGKRTAILLASRGCPFNCCFCANPVWRLQKPLVRKRTPESIAAEVDLLYDRGVREIYIVSDEMNPDAEALDWTTAVFTTLGKKCRSDLYFQCNLRVKPINEALVESLIMSNCWLVYLGIESFSQRVLDGIGKHITVAEAKHACMMLSSKRISVFAFLMQYQVWEENGHLCHETTREVLASLWHILALRLHAAVHYMSWGFAAPYPGSRLYDIARKYCMFNDGDALRGVFLPHTITIHIPGISLHMMRITRFLGLLMQALFIIMSFDYLKRRVFVTNIRVAISRLLPLQKRPR